MPALVNLFKGLSDPTRLAIVGLLLGSDELCVCELTTALRLPQSTVSRHLAYLKRTGWLVSRQAGLWMHYRIAEAVREQHGDLLEVVAAAVALQPELDSCRRSLFENRGNRHASC